MEPRPKSGTRKPTGRMKKTAKSAKTAFDLASLPHLADLIEEGEITVGTVDPVGCIAAATDGNTCLAMLVRRDGETLTQLLERLDLAVAKAFLDDIFTDEVNTPAKKR